MTDHCEDWTVQCWRGAHGLGAKVSDGAGTLTLVLTRFSAPPPANLAALQVAVAGIASEYERGMWQAFCAALVGMDGVLARTTSEPVGPWLTQQRHWEPDRPNAAALAVVQAGIAPADLLAYALISEAGSEPVDDPDRATDLRFFMQEVGGPHPSMSVRDTVGWTMLHAQSEWGLDPQRWVAAGLGDERGWLASAAGLSIDEARTGWADGSVTVEGARAMAALRGVRIPVG